MKKHRCLCCGNLTLESRGAFDICPVCFWEDDTPYGFSNIGDEAPAAESYGGQEPAAEKLLDRTSGANHGLTLRQARENYRSFGACEKEMLPYVRAARENEKCNKI